MGKHCGYYETPEPPAVHPNDYVDPYTAIDRRMCKLIDSRMDEDTHEITPAPKRL